MSLPVIATIVEAYRLFFANLTLYARLYWFPVLMQLGAAVLAYHYLAAPESGDSMWPSVAAFLAEFFAWMLEVPAMTAWSRLVILGRDGHEARLTYSVAMVEWRYLLWQLLIVATAGVVLGFQVAVVYYVEPISAAMETPMVGDLIIMAMLGVAVFSVVRFLLVLPAAAVGSAASLADSYRVTRGNGPRLFLLIVLALMPAYLSYLALNYLYFGITADVQSSYPMGYLVAEKSIYAFFITIDVSILAVAYRMFALKASVST